MLCWDMVFLYIHYIIHTILPTPQPYQLVNYLDFHRADNTSTENSYALTHAGVRLVACRDEVAPT